MHRMVLLTLDVVLLLTATLVAFFLRENFTISEQRWLDALPYFAATLATTFIVFPLASLHRTVWRFSGFSDILRVSLAVIAVSVATVASTFAYNRLEGVARALPFLQALVGIVTLVGIRILYKANHTWRRRRRASETLFRVPDEIPAETVLIVGISPLTEAYLHALAELAAGNVIVAGLVGQSDRHVGRLISSYPVLGKPEDVERILDTLHLQGVAIARIVVTSSTKGLSRAAQEALSRVERNSAISVQFLSECLGFERGSKALASQGDRTTVKVPLTFEIATAELEDLARRPFWSVKRLADRAVALALLVVLLPLILVLSVAVAFDLGFPIFFWQQRPGLGGRPFRLYKFRTMAQTSYLNAANPSDAERVSKLGQFLRRTRLDELPQLINILRGDMSFIGPRPLLAREQSEAHRSRLLVRPGLTGWAQVVGGRDISAADKAALDVWYVRNASFALDLRIAVRTIPMVLLGERPTKPLIRRCWLDLKEAGIFKAEAY